MVKTYTVPVLQDDMIDEEKAKKEVAGQMTFQEKMDLLDQQVISLGRIEKYENRKFTKQFLLEHLLCGFIA